MQNLKELLIKSLNIVNNKEISIIYSASKDLKYQKYMYQFYTNNISHPMALYFIGIFYQSIIL
jgi:hypothetical protein